MSETRPEPHISKWRSLCSSVRSKLKLVKVIRPNADSMQDTARDCLSHKELEDEIEQYIMILRRANLEAAISRIPSEILAEIFMLVARETMLYFFYRPMQSRLRWISIAQVCHAWREVALTTPLLWSMILNGRPDAMKELFVRSQQAPLSITIDELYCFNGIDTYLGELLAPNLHRLSDLRFGGKALTIHRLCAMLTLPAHSLHTLRLLNTGKFTTSPELHADLFSRQVPRLRILEICGLGIRWDHSLFANTLTTLNVHADAPYGSFEQLLSALEQMTHLEVIQLVCAIPSPDEHARLLLPSRTIALPRLHSISLVGIAADCADLLRHLEPANGVMLQIAAQNGTEMQDLIDAVKMHLTNMEPFRTVSLVTPPPVWGQPRMTLFAWPTEIDVTEMPLYHTSSLHLALSLADIRRLLSDLVLWYSTRFLQVERVADRGWDWREIFSRMPNLCRIDFSYAHVFGNAFDALSAVHAVEGEHSPWVVLPRLEVLSFRECTLGEHTMPRLIFCLITRSIHICPVQEVRLASCRHITMQDIDRLRERVPKVSWDGKVIPRDGEPYILYAMLPPWP